MAIRISDMKEFTRTELERLFLAAGSPLGGNAARLKRGLLASQQVVSAWDGRRLVGLARAIGDGQTSACIDLVAVDPLYAGEGVEGLLLAQLHAALQGMLFVHHTASVTGETDGEKP